MTLGEGTHFFDHSTLHGKFHRLLNRLEWRHAFLPMFCLIPFILWIGVIQDYNSIQTTFLQNGSNLESSSSMTEFANTAMSLVETYTVQTTNPTATFDISTPKYNEPNKTVAEAEYELVITSGHLAPDNFLQETYLINEMFPGPTIRVKQNARLKVRVQNNLSRNAVTIHFHGIHQRRSFLSDGVPNVTQKPILPGESYTYTFDTWPQTGTFFYHAHTGLDIVSLYGAIVIEYDPAVYQTWPAAYQYDEEKVFTLNGVYHESLVKLVTDIVGPVHNYPRNIESITFNGKSFGVWDNQTNRKASGGYEVVSVKRGKRYRFRFINAASDSMLVCNISVFTVIEMDGVYTEPVETDQLLISPGQRYSIVIEMTQDPGNYEVSCRHTDTFGPKNGIAILNYKGAIYPSKQLRQQDRGTEKENLPLSRWVLDDLVPNYSLKQVDVYALPPNVDREFFVDVEEIFDGSRNYYVINGHRYEEPSIPYFTQLSQKANISTPNQVFEILTGEVVQFVFQNRLRGNGTDSVCFSHPWHIHGHTFFVVGEGPDAYDPAEDGRRIKERTQVGNTNKFRFRDTVTLFANQSAGLEQSDAWGAPCGWTAVRFVANNPGIWLSHCHVTPHLLMGKKFILWEHSQADPFLLELMN